MNPVISRATGADIAELRQLYYAVYGPHYPVALGTDPARWPGSWTTRTPCGSSPGAPARAP